MKWYYYYLYMLLPYITKKQQEILLLLYKFRFLTRPQIQTLLHHKNVRRVNEWLPDLVKKKYLGRILDTEHKIHNTPAIYYIADNGIRFLKTHPKCEKRYMNRFYDEDEKTVGFINQSILIGDIYLSLLEKYKDNPDFAFYTRSDYSLDGIIREIFPYFVFRRDEGESYYIAEIFQETAPRKKAIQPRIRKYVHFFTQEKWLKHEPLPKLLFICPNETKRALIQKDTLKILQDEDSQELSIYTTVQQQVKQQGIDGDVWIQVKEE